MKDNQFEVFYASLALLFVRSQKNYELYSSNGQSFGFALGIYRSNKEICALLIANAVYIPNKDAVSVFELLSHYDSWFTQFDLLEKELNPVFNTLFVFQRAHGAFAFPRAYQNKVINMYDAILIANS